MDIAASTDAINGQAATEDRELHLVRPEELHAAWQQVQRGVDRVIEATHADWLREDLYVSLRQGVTQLYVGYVHQYYVGFVAVTPTAGWTGPQWHIWAAFNRGERDVLQTFLPDLVALAKAAGAQKLTMSSPRKGWERRAVQLGFHEFERHYALEV